MVLSACDSALSAVADGGLNDALNGTTSRQMKSSNRQAVERSLRNY